MVTVIPLNIMKCRCDCGEFRGPGSVFLPGHDLRAAMRCIIQHYGSVEDFIDEHEPIEDEE